jgi:hypothetical protein
MVTAETEPVEVERKIANSAVDDAEVVVEQLVHHPRAKCRMLFALWSVDVRFSNVTQVM